MKTPATHAHIQLCRLGGYNEKVPVQRRGAFVYVKDPHRPKTYRIDAAKFDAGQVQIRGSFAIGPWDERSERRAASEWDWQD